MQPTAWRFAVYSFLVYSLMEVATSGAPAAHSISKRVVNGRRAYLGTIPYQVSLQMWMGFQWRHLCGGSLIALNKVLTAAHCVNKIPLSRIRVGLGWLHMDNINGLEQNIAVAKVVVHSEYLPNAAGFPNDVALLTLVTNVRVNMDVKTVPPLPPGTLNSSDLEECVISGWGNGLGFSHGMLTETNISVISNDDCAARLANISKAAVFDHHICVFEKPKAACHGDSGGPLVCKGNLVGVSSYGVRSCTGNFPSVYALVSYFYEWIMEHLID